MSVAANLAEIRQGMGRAVSRCGRTLAEVRLVGVTKTFPVAAIEEALSAGLCDIAENRVQEAQAKFPALEHHAVLERHFIGPIQTNKVKFFPALFDWVQTVCRPEEFLALERHYAAAGKHVNVLLQVNTGGEAQKNGVAPADLPAMLIEAGNHPHLHPRGLMTIPPYTGDPDSERPYYRRLRELRDAALTEGFEWCRELSMGMSHDFEAAIEEGATIVRVGTALFGERGGSP